MVANDDCWLTDSGFEPEQAALYGQGGSGYLSACHRLVRARFFSYRNNWQAQVIKWVDWGLRGTVEMGKESKGN